jgi:hypothetical protein
MRRVRKSESRQVKGVKLYLNDYHELIEILQQSTGGESKLDVEADEYELNAPEDIKQLQRTVVHELRVVRKTTENDSMIYRRWLSVTITGSEATVHFTSPPDPDHGLALEVLEFLKKSRPFGTRFRYFFFRGPGLMFASIPLIVVGAVMLSLSKRSASTSTFASVMLAGATVLSLAGTIRIGSLIGEKTTKEIAVVLKERGQESSFVQRHKESLEKLAIAVVAAIVGAAVKWLFDRR